MNIRILKNTQEFNGVLLNNNKVLDTVYSKSQFNGVDLINYFIFDLENNTSAEILPEIRKYNLIEIIDASWNSKYIYFSDLTQNIDGKAEIRIIRYDYINKTNDVIYTFYEEMTHFTEDKKEKHTKIFILNDTYIIFQISHLKSNICEDFEDFMDFQLFLYNIKEDSRFKIIDESLVNNGIHSIKPLSETHYVIKTGYSLLENKRKEYLTKEEVCVEGISIINIQQFISDLLLINKNLVIDTIDQAYYTKTFPYILVENNYLIYSAVNFETNEEELFFYNNVTKETRSCINQNVKSIDDLAKPCIIGDNPYIRLNTQKGTEFFNINRAKIDVRFNNDEKVSDIINNLFIISETKKYKLINKETPYFSIYKYPQMSLIHKEKAEYLGGVSTDSNNLYIFVK